MLLLTMGMPQLCGRLIGTLVAESRATWRSICVRTLEDFLQNVRLRTSLLVFLLCQMIGTGLALGVAHLVPAVITTPGLGTELLRGLPALLIILVAWRGLAARSIRPTEGLAQILQCVTGFDLAAIVLFNLAAGIVSILAILLAMHRLSPGSLAQALGSEQPTPLVLIVGAVTATTLAPLSEEIVFRGWLLNGLKRRIPLWPAIIASSLAFAAIHPSLSMATTFLFGVCAAIAYIKTRNLWVSIVLHGLNNLLIACVSIAESLLIRVGLVSDNSASLEHLALILGLPSLVLSLWLAVHLIQKKQFFNLRVPLCP